MDLFCESYILFLHLNDLHLCSGGISKGPGYPGDNGTVTGKACPEGLYGTFCKVLVVLSLFRTELVFSVPSVS